MIVQCEHCQTKYRIADDKVKGKGVKVRCAKCENVFTVTPPGSEVPAQTAAPSPLPPVEGPPPPPRQDTGPDPGTEEKQGSPEIPSPPAQDSPGPDMESPGVELPSMGVPPDAEPDGFETPPPGETHGEHGSARPAHEMDHGGLASQPPGPTELPEDEGLQIEGTMREEATSAAGPFGSGAGGGVATASQDSETGWGNIAIGGQEPPDSAESGFDLADSPGYEPPPPVPTEETGRGDLSGPADESSKTTSSTSAHQLETGRPRGSKKGLLLLLLLAVLAAGGYYSYPAIMKIVQSRGQQPGGTLTPSDVQVKALTRTDGKIIYVVRGKIMNGSSGNVGMIQVEAQFRSASDDVLTKATSYCGNLFEDGDLVRMDINRVKSDLQNELGQSLSNASIRPGQAVPFLVVLDNPPAGVSKVTVTILSFKETT